MTLTKHEQRAEGRGGVELLPCPFCGGDKARTIHIRDGRKAVCPCGVCGKPCFHGTPDMPSADERAITAWNTRTSAEAELVEALADLHAFAKDAANGTFWRYRDQQISKDIEALLASRKETGR